MARKYTKEELKERLQRSIYKVVAEEGIEGVTVRKVSKGCGLSDPYIYQCYKDLFDLMETSFFEVDGKAAGMIRKLIQNQKAELKTAEDLESMCWTLWSAYWEFLMSDPEQTIFYWRFYQSAHYTKKILEVRQQSFEVFVNYMVETGRMFGVSDLMDPEVIVSNIIDSTESVAVKMHLGYMDKTALKARTIYKTVFALLFQLLHIDVWNGEI